MSALSPPAWQLEKQHNETLVAANEATRAERQIRADLAKARAEVTRLEQDLARRMVTSREAWQLEGAQFEAWSTKLLEERTEAAAHRARAWAGEP